jgi:hypothetical protein
VVIVVVAVVEVEVLGMLSTLLHLVWLAKVLIIWRRCAANTVIHVLALRESITD